MRPFDLVCVGLHACLNPQVLLTAFAAADGDRNCLLRFKEYAAVVDTGSPVHAALVRWVWQPAIHPAHVAASVLAWRPTRPPLAPLLAGSAVVRLDFGRWRGGLQGLLCRGRVSSAAGASCDESFVAVFRIPSSYPSQMRIGSSEVRVDAAVCCLVPCQTVAGNSDASLDTLLQVLKEGDVVPRATLQAVVGPTLAPAGKCAHHSHGQQPHVTPVVR
jgi:hypothetical protein